MSKDQEIFKKLAKRHSTPEKVQKFLKTFEYNREEEGETVRSALLAHESKKVHCLEACMVSAAILEHQGYEPLILNLDSADNLNHAVYAFKEKTGWGSIGRSRDFGLHGREPRFRSLRDLAFSYFDPYVDLTGKIIGYAVSHLDDTQTDWRFSERNVRKVEAFVTTLKFIPLKAAKSRYEKALRKFKKHGAPLEGKYWW